ncbi:FMN-dependent NADH-azoreductase [Actinomadura yumaensis]|uniref:FMN-dependent NADH-azoreductase n=1 Tax=Actinomadura yumaensis TaxID=111807 RepID=UPI00360B3D63
MPTVIRTRRPLEEPPCPPCCTWIPAPAAPPSAARWGRVRRVLAGEAPRRPAPVPRPGRRPGPPDHRGLDGDLRQRPGVRDHRAPRLKEAARTPAQKAAWAVLEPLLEELVAADVVLIASPMYNYTVPASLKAWIDQVTFPRMNLAPRRFVVATARGGSYAPGTPKAPFDHQETLLRDFFAGHYGVKDVAFLNAELVNSRVDPALAGFRAAHDESYAAALRAAAELARDY